MFDLLPGWVPTFGQWCLLVVTSFIGLIIGFGFCVAVVSLFYTFGHDLWEDFTEWRRRRK